MGTARRRALTTLLVVLATLAGLALVAPTQARAAERFCTGYDGCAAAGFSDDGYAENARTYWWRMELGHNCTNYAAYRMVRSGMANSRPWTGNGDAHTWGHAMAGITDAVPRVGSVAWWDAGAGGHGRLGHVAYVEKVVSPDTIVISQDVFEGDFSWARISRSGGEWPSGFIHFHDERLRVTSHPRVSGRPRVGVPLRASAGRWSAPVSLSYRWYAGSRPVRGATRATFTPTPAQARDRLRVRVTARSSGYEPVVVTTASTAPVGLGALRVTRKPRTTGEARVGTAVRVRLPRVTPRPDRTRVRWLLDGHPVPGTRGDRRVLLGPRARGRSLAVEVTVSRRGYESLTRRVRVGRVGVGRIAVRRPFAVAGTPAVGRELRVVGGRHTPADARVGYLWFRDKEPIADARRSTYVVRPEDAGHRVAVVIGLRRRGYESLLTGVVAGVVPAP